MMRDRQAPALSSALGGSLDLLKIVILSVFITVHNSSRILQTVPAPVSL